MAPSSYDKNAAQNCTPASNNENSNWSDETPIAAIANHLIEAVLAQKSEVANETGPLNIARLGPSQLSGCPQQNVIARPKPTNGRAIVARTNFPNILRFLHSRNRNDVHPVQWVNAAARLLQAVGRLTNKDSWPARLVRKSCNNSTGLRPATSRPSDDLYSRFREFDKCKTCS